MTGRRRLPFGPFGGILHSLPPFPGEGRLFDLATRLVSLLGGAQREAHLWPGVPFRVDLRDRIQRQMWRARYEPHLTSCLEALLGPGDVFCDVGAHIGYISCFAAGLVGKSGQVLSFEADPLLFAQLKKNLEPFSWAISFHCAVWDENRTITFSRTPNKLESGWGTVGEVRDIPAAEHVPVPAATLDSVFSSLSSSTVAAIKIDAEGSEPRILAGAANLLQSARPAIFLEVNSVLLSAAGCSSERLAKTLLHGGFRLFRLSFQKLAKVPTLAKLEFQDLLCLPEEKAEKLLSNFQAHGFSLC